ncbi:MAG TPA: M4 family metallopeptidase, partial [Anaerolineales bacterium]|nr:M4 family metallopeptidase [Anaerolineales bacterium]
MSTILRLSRLLFVTIIISSIGLSVIQPRAVSAQVSDGIKRQINAESGKISFIGPESGRAVPAAQALGIFARPADPAVALARRFAPQFGLNDPVRNLSVKQTETLEGGRITARFQQSYQGIPVIGAELMIHTNGNGDLISINGEVSPNVSLQTQPSIESEQAMQTALQAIAKWYKKSTAEFTVTSPELWIYDESLLHSSNRPVELVWRMEVISLENSLAVHELVLVNAHRGQISLHFNQIDTAWHSDATKLANGPHSTRRETSSENTALLFSALVNTHTANSTSSLPGTLLCNQSQPNCTNGSNLNADSAHKYAMGTFNLYDSKHNRNSINNGGMTIISTVEYCEGFDCPYGNAFWSGTQMVYGNLFGFARADDVVGHELTHGVTQYESNLFYYYQSGAINESFSDLWGEYYDQTNSQGTDTAPVKWQIGEDVTGYGAFRNMNDPAAFGDPDRMSSPNYHTTDDDNGGVHHNSALNNKAVYLMVDGGSFNGKTVTALGWDKTAAIYYEAQTNLLLSGSDYSDLFYALQQACSNLIGQKG